MNERIERLAFKVMDEPVDLERTYLKIDVEKFAELIVAECIECADFVGQVNIASGYPNSTAHHVKQKIKQHFGVEE